MSYGAANVPAASHVADLVASATSTARLKQLGVRDVLRALLTRVLVELRAKDEAQKPEAVPA